MSALTVANTSINIARPCSVKESLVMSCKEVKQMQEGKPIALSLDDLFCNISKWKVEIEKGE